MSLAPRRLWASYRGVRRISALGASGVDMFRAGPPSCEKRPANSRRSQALDAADAQEFHLCRSVGLAQRLGVGGLVLAHAPVAVQRQPAADPADAPDLQAGVQPFGQLRVDLVADGR